MNSAKVLESITDRGLFELLATSVIRKSDKKYEAVIHTGINVRGEPIKSPVDGFCLVPRSKPPQFIIVQHTTTDIKNLERKWLYDKASEKRISRREDGDFTKAIHEAQKIRKNIPNAEFIIVLTTNRRPPKDLIEKVYKKANKYKVDVDIWEQSRISDFLDTNAEGQWLRKKHLGIEAELLSRALLEKLCYKSLNLYERELLETGPQNWISREVDVQIEKAMHSIRYTLHFFLGESGFGKSVAAYKLLQKHLEACGIGLFIPAELLKDCFSLETTIDKYLRHLYPHLKPDINKSILQFVKKDSRLLIIVDDINRSEDSAKLVTKLISWTKPQKPDTYNLQQSTSPYLIICPIWPHTWGALSHVHKEISWIKTIFIGPLNSKEAEKAVRKVTSEHEIEITETEANELAVMMGNDPYLIGLFSSLLSGARRNSLKKLAENVIEKFISSCVEETASTIDSPYLASEYRKALHSLSLQMLLKKKFYPLWAELDSWFDIDSQTIKALRKLIQNGKLCRLNNQDQFIFRHDRILEVFLIESIKKIISAGDLDNEILYEPFYAHLIGQALAYLSVDLEFIKQMREKLPLVLTEAIRYFSTPTSTIHNAIIEEIKGWWEKNVANDLVPDSVLDAVCWSLVETDSPAVIDITDSYHPYALINLARLRNGCTKSGATYCIGRHGLAPSYKDDLRDRILEHAKSRHEETFLNDLKQLLKSAKATDEEREGFLALVGFLGFSILQEEIAKCWELAIDKTRVLPEAIWAATQCCGSNPSKILDPLMKYWDELSEEKDKFGHSQKSKIADILRFALARGINNDVINYFIQQSKLNDSLRLPITLIIEHIDAPDAIEYIVKSAAEIDRKNEGTDRFSPWSSMLALRWDSSQPTGRSLSQDSLTRLKDLWDDPKSDDFIKKQAFRLWLTGIKWEQINILRSIPSNSPLFQMALKKRVKLRDYKAIQDLLPFLTKETHWLDEVHNIWCDEFIAPVQQHLESLKETTPKDFSGGWTDDHHFLSKLLMRIPEETAEKFLTEYWEHLGYSPLFIQTALYVGTATCLKLADFSINKCPRHVKIFQHVQFSFGFWNEKQKYLSKRRLDNLIPYIDRLGESELRELADVCERLGIPEWSQKHISDLLSEKHRKRYNPSDDDLLQQLSEFENDKHGVIRVKFWLEEFEKRHDHNDRALNIIDRWLASSPTVERLKIVASCIQNIGTRNDLSIFEKYKIKDSSDEIAKIKESARFFVYRRSLE